MPINFLSESQIQVNVSFQAKKDNPFKKLRFGLSWLLVILQWFKRYYDNHT